MPKENLTPFEKHVIEQKGTEPAFTGLYTNTTAAGVYVCKRCQTPLYLSEHKFLSHCGWPSFDDEIPGAIKKQPDADGRRTEILCNACDAHLGHIFQGEHYTPKNIRHCVNSVSMDFLAREDLPTQRAILASGCFWGTEYFLGRMPGVSKTIVGFTGGHVENPSYEQVCEKNTGHFEAVEVHFDPSQVSYESLLRLFFETHNFTQKDGQGPDIGPQYRSAIFYLDENQRNIAEKLITQLKEKGYEPATEILSASKFWPAEKYHQKYYERKGDSPYCHIYKKIF